MGPRFPTSPAGRVLSEKSISLQALRVPEKARRELDSNHHHASCWLGFVYLAAGRNGKALESFRQFLRRNQGAEDSQVRHLVSSLEKIVR